MDLVKSNQQRSIQRKIELPDHLIIKPSIIGHRLKKDIENVSVISVTPDGKRLAVI